jgi:hypothetical protein
MIPIVRIYATAQQARDAARALGESGFAEDAVFVLTAESPAESAAEPASGAPTAPRDKPDAAAALLAGYAFGSYPRVFTAEHARSCAEALAKGRSIVGVQAKFGEGAAAIAALDQFDPVDTHRVAPEPERKRLDWDDGAPLSSALGLPVLLRNSPDPASDFLGIPALSKGHSFMSEWFRPLTKSTFSLSSLFGMRLLSKNAAPLSSLIGMKPLSPKQDVGNRSFGLPLLSRNPAPLSSMFGLPTLSRPRKKGPWKRSFGLPLLTDDD